jgi:hypothetical protein
MEKSEKSLKEYAVWLLSIAALPALMFAQLMLRKFPVGDDSYFFLLNARAGVVDPAMPPLFQHLAIATAGWGHLVIPSILAAVDIILLMMIGRKMKLNNWHLVGLALLFVPVFMFRAAIFEDDILGLPFMLLAVLIFLHNKWAGLAATLPIMFVWKMWAVLAAMMVFFILPGIPAAVMLFGMAAYFVAHYWSWGVAEVLPLSIGVAFIFYPMILPFIRMVIGKARDNEFLFRWSLFSVALGMVAARFLILAAFPMALLFCHTEGWKQKGLLVGGFAIAMVLASACILYFSMPDPGMMDCLVAHPDATVDWSMGYYIQWVGGHADYTPYAPHIAPDDYEVDIRFNSWQDDCAALDAGVTPQPSTTPSPSATPPPQVDTTPHNVTSPTRVSDTEYIITPEWAP